jgi:indole-3-glycerol phosphate synthase
MMDTSTIDAITQHAYPSTPTPRISGPFALGAPRMGPRTVLGRYAPLKTAIAIAIPSKNKATNRFDKVGSRFPIVVDMVLPWLTVRPRIADRRLASSREVYWQFHGFTMSNRLDEIVAHKRLEVSARRTDRPVEQLRDMIAELGRPRNFFHAVTRKSQGPLNLIGEIHRASPDAGVIRADFDPIAIAKQYASGGASALSIHTDERYFQGRLDDLHAVRDVVKLPVLRKDFIIDPYQVYESRAFGADAILLIADCLETSQLIDLQILATELHMTCLIEVHDIDNLMRVRDRVIGFPHRSYSLIGINNRDLRTSIVDIGTTLRLAELIEDRSVLVSESGIESHDDVKKLADAGVRAVLVGESLLRAQNVAESVRQLLYGK